MPKTNNVILTTRRCLIIKRRSRWCAAPGGVKGVVVGGTCHVLLTVSVRLSLRPSVRLSCQTAAEPIIQSVSSPWRPDLLHTRTPPDCESEEIETFAGFFCSGNNHKNLPLTISSSVPFLSKNNQKGLLWIVSTVTPRGCTDSMKRGQSRREKEDEEDERFHHSHVRAQAGLFSSLVLGFLRYFAFRVGAKFAFSNPPFEPKPFLRHPLPSIRQPANKIKNTHHHLTVAGGQRAGERDK